MADGENIQADNNSIAFGGINVGGNVGDIRIGHTVGFTSEQVSTLITQISTTFQPKPFDGRSPYKGLDVFEEEDAELFFGREKLVDDLVSRVKDSCTVFITGPSGSGKSSLVRAGLIHALKQGMIPGSERWLYATMKPGREPIQTLARAVAGLVMSTNAEDEIRARALTDESIFARWCEIAVRDGRDKRVVLFIDQFEEVFTQISREEERVAFLNLLTHAAAVENGRVILLFSMRSDFVPNCATYPKLNALLNQQFVQIGAMQGDELVSAIAQPALRVGLRIDPDLIAQIINDMQGEPGALPLMQFALKDLFDAQQAKGGLIALTLSDYLERGGIRKALERHADQTFAHLSIEEQDLARSIFTGLIEIGRGTQDTRRTAIFEELVPASAQTTHVEAIIAKLADARLITTDEIGGKDTVTISHEKLIDAWPWLKKLVNENRDVIAMQNEIAEDAKEWEEHKRDSSYLYSGVRLVNAREQLKANKLTLSGTANEFVQAGFARQQREQQTRLFSIAGVVGLIIAGIALFSYVSTSNAKQLAEQSENSRNTQVVIAATAQAASTLAVEKAGEAQQKTMLAWNGELSAEAVALRNKKFQLSLLLAVEAYKDPISNQSYEALLENVQSHPQLRTYLSGHRDAVTSVAFSSDGKTLASGSRDNTIILWDVATGTQVRQLMGHDDYVTSVAFSPDGTTLASGSRDTTIILWDVATGHQAGQLIGHTDYVFSVAFSPDGKTLASGGKDQAVILWDVPTGHPVGRPFKGHKGYVTSVAFSPDGKTLASGSRDTTIILWDVETGSPVGEPLAGHTADVTSLAFSGDGKTLASSSRDETIILWDVATGTKLKQMMAHANYVTSVAFSPDGKTLASGSWDRTIILWDVATGSPVGEPLKGHTDSIFSYVTSVAFSPDGKTLASGSRDRTIILWDVMRNHPLGRELKESVEGISNLAFSLDGKTLSAAGDTGVIVSWDVAEGRSSGQSVIENASNLTFSPDRKSLAFGNKDGTITLWDVGAGKPIGQPLVGNAATLAFSLDGKTAAFGTQDGNIILWDVGAGKPIGQPLYGNPTAISFSADGKTLAILSGGLTVVLLDVTSGNVENVLVGHTQVINVIAFSPDGNTLASGSDDATIILWDVSKGTQRGEPLEGHTQPVTALAFSPDGNTLASGSCVKANLSTTCIEGEVLLWDLTNQQLMGLPFIGHTKMVTKLAFIPDGKTLASGSEDSTIILWDLNPQSWIEKSCQRANRNFTRAEWEQYFPAQRESYQITCKQFSPGPHTTTADGIATPAPAPPSSPVIRPASYSVQLGESLICIARRYNVSPKELLALNALADDWVYGEVIYPNLTILIPQSGNPFPGATALRSHPALYTVASANETLSSIACSFGEVEPSAIAMANGLSIDTALVPGQQLSIP